MRFERRIGPLEFSRQAVYILCPMSTFLSAMRVFPMPPGFPRQQWAAAWLMLFCGSVTSLSGQSNPAKADYRIGNGDVLQVSVWEEPQLNRTVTVRPDGKISFPLISDSDVTGLTTSGAQSLLERKLANMVKHAQVTVMVSEVHSKLVYVTGAVQKAGAYPLTEQINVLQLIARAGGVTKSAKTTKVYVLRQPGSQKLLVNYKAVVQGNRNQDDIELQPGDTVVVP